MNRQDFKDWQSQPITKAYFLAITNRIELLKEELAQSAADDPKWDAVKRGAIAALRDITDVDWFEETQV
jgi:hypothetical protein